MGIDRIGAYIPSLFFTFDIQAFHSLTVTILTVQSHACYVIFQGLLEGVSHSFTKNFHFIDSVKAYLSYALLRASVSQSPVIFQVLLNCITFLCVKYPCVNCDIDILSWQYATGIFLVLLLRFRESLKVCMSFCRFCRSFLMLI